MEATYIRHVFSLQRIELDFFTCFTCLDLRFDRRIYIYIQVSNEFLWIENTKRGISNESESSIEERKREEVYRGKREKEQEEEKVQTEIYNSRKEKSATNALGNID